MAFSNGGSTRHGETNGVVIRPAILADHDAIVGLGIAALGWRAGEPHDELFRWKHLRNPFGASPMWVAEADGRIVAFRAMLRWEFESGDRVHRAVRAVDTATHPDHQGRGLFRVLTMHAVDALTADGVDFVFNTPNGKSRPGYLKMGWQIVGRVPVAVRVASPASLVRIARARVPAGKWSLPGGTGEPVDGVLADADAIAALLDSQPPASGLMTRRSVEFLRWRYADGPVRYRALLATNRVEDGIALFRVRRRGTATEATLCDVIVPGGDPRAARRLVDRVLRATRADYVIHAQRRWIDHAHVRLPKQGPVLTWRGLASTDQPRLDRWRLGLGDIELF